MSPQQTKNEPSWFLFFWRLVFCNASIFMLAACQTTQTQQRMKPVVSAPVKPTSTVQASTYGLFVGIGRYHHGTWSQQPTAAEDAKSLAESFQKDGHLPSSQVFLLTDQQATKEKILDAIEQLNQKLTPKDTLVLFFSGYGFEDTRGGAWMTYDTNPQQQRSTSLRPTELLDGLRTKRVVLFLHTLTPSRPHVFVSLSGVRRPSRVVLEAAQDKQPVAFQKSHSAFALALLQTLRAATDPNRDGTLTLDELMPVLQKQLRNYTAAQSLSYTGPYTSYPLAYWASTPSPSEQEPPVPSQIPPRPRATPPQDYGTLELTLSEKNVVLYLDGNPVTRVEKHSFRKALPAKEYRVLLKKPGFFPYRTTLQIRSQKTLKLHLRLRSKQTIALATPPSLGIAPQQPIRRPPPRPRLDAPEDDSLQDLLGPSARKETAKPHSTRPSPEPREAAPSPKPTSVEPPMKRKAPKKTRFIFPPRKHKKAYLYAVCPGRGELFINRTPYGHEGYRGYVGLDRYRLDCREAGRWYGLKVNFFQSGQYFDARARLASVRRKVGIFDQRTIHSSTQARSSSNDKKPKLSEEQGGWGQKSAQINALHLGEAVFSNQGSEGLSIGGLLGATFTDGVFLYGFHAVSHFWLLRNAQLFDLAQAYVGLRLRLARGLYLGLQLNGGLGIRLDRLSQDQQPSYHGSIRPFLTWYPFDNAGLAIKIHGGLTAMAMYGDTFRFLYTFGFSLPVSFHRNPR